MKEEDKRVNREVAEIKGLNIEIKGDKQITGGPLTVVLISNQRTRRFPEWELKQGRGETWVSQSKVSESMLQMLLQG